MPAHDPSEFAEKLLGALAFLGSCVKVLKVVAKRIAEYVEDAKEASDKKAAGTEVEPPSWDYVRLLESDRAEAKAEVARLNAQVAHLYNALDSGTRKGALDPPETP